MDNLAALARQLKSVSSLENLVKTLKVLSAVNVRQFTRTKESLEAYLQNIEAGLQVVLRELPDPPARSAQGAPRRVLFGSDHGLCGAFHQQLLHQVPPQKAPTRLICIGTRLAEAAQDQGLQVDKVLSAPTSTAGIAEVAGQLLGQLQPLDGTVEMLYQRNHNSVYQPLAEILWPLSEDWLSQIRQRLWLAADQKGGLPRCWGDPTQALDWLLEERIQVSCQLALAHSLASENQARLQTMQAAEKNLDEMRAGLQERLQSRRQNAVTEELLDVIAGFEILNQEAS